MAGTTAGAVDAQATSIGHNSTIDEILVGEATETPDSVGLWYDNGANYANVTGAIKVNASGIIGINAGSFTNFDGLVIAGQNVAPSGTYAQLPSISIDYTDGDHLTPDNKVIVTIPVTNVTDDDAIDGSTRKYTRMNVDYVGSQYDIFDSVEKTHTTNIEPSSYDGSTEYVTVDYVFELTLKDGVNGYVDWEKFMTDNSEGHAPIVEDLEFNISGHENSDAGYIGDFSENFYLGDPETVDPNGLYRFRHGLINNSSK